MSSPLLWFGQKARLLKSILQIPGSTSGSIDIAAPATPTPYQITLPPAQGTPGDVPTLDGSLNLQWQTPGTVPVTTFPLANNQVAPANVTGFLVNSAVNTGFHAEVTVRRESNITVVGGNDGTPNAAFQTNLGTGIDAPGIVFASIVLPSGDIIIAGDFSTYNGIGTPRIAKISSTGVLDAAFTANLNVGPNGQVNALYRQASGKIVVGGNFTQFDGTARGYLARINADGTHDLTFMSTNGFDAQVQSIGSLSATNNSNLIIGGSFNNFTDELGGVNAAPQVFGISVDGQYVVPGIVFAPVGTGFNGSVNAIAVDSATDDIYFTGPFDLYDGVTAFKTMKSNAAGVKQSGFDDLGSSALTDAGYGIAIQPDGKVLVSGNVRRAVADRVPLWRYDATGADDTTFNNNLSIAAGNGQWVLGLQSDGKILVGGASTYDGVRRLARINSDGTADTTFNTAILPGFDTGAFISTIAIGADDVAYVGGQFNAYYTGTVPNNIIMLGQFSSSSTVESWMKTSIEGIYKPFSADWEIAFGPGPVSSPDTGVAFTMTALGQLQYTSSNLAGTPVVSEMRYTLLGL